MVQADFARPIHIRGKMSRIDIRSIRKRPAVYTGNIVCSGLAMVPVGNGVMVPVHHGVMVYLYHSPIDNVVMV